MSRITALITGLMLVCAVATACGDKSTSQAERDAARSTDGYHYDDNSGYYGDGYDRDGNGIYDDNSANDSMNGIEKIVTGARDAVDSVISEGADLVDDAVGSTSATVTR